MTSLCSSSDAVAASTDDAVLYCWQRNGDSDGDDDDDSEYGLI